MKKGKNKGNRKHKYDILKKNCHIKKAIKKLHFNHENMKLLNLIKYYKNIMFIISYSYCSKQFS